LPAEYKDHPLKLNWAGYRDAHIEPDWVLIYSATAEKVHFERTGTHEELFEND
jgi:mRNA interferase YafQ